MEKEQNSKTEENINNKTKSSESSENNKELKEKETELSPEDKIKELEEKLTRTLAEMENQRRRFEKEKDDAFEYGGFSFGFLLLSGASEDLVFLFKLSSVLEFCSFSM